MARIGKEELPTDKLNTNQNTSSCNLLNSDNSLNNKENMDDRFDDVLKVNKNNKNSDIYKKYEELIQQSEEKESERLSNAYSSNASFYSALKPKSAEVENDIPTEEVVENFDKSEIEPRDSVMFDLFNLNIKDSEEENLYEEKKLVNNKQKIINEDNKVEVVEENKEPNYSFQKDSEYNYHDTFGGLRKNTVKKTSKAKFENVYNNDSPVTTVDLKNKLYASGYKIRTYQKLESEGYYANKYYLNNKLNRDCSIITAIIMMLVIGIMWIAFDSFVNLPVYAYIIMMASFLLIPAFSLIKYLNCPKARKLRDFSFKLSILNAIMAYLIITVICLLVAFFAVGADISNISTLVCPLFYPMFILLVLPIYVIIYQLLYITNKYIIE